MALKIYTKTGDNGTTSLIGGTKVHKSHLRIDAYGTIDELNSYVGLCKDLLNSIQEEKSTEILQKIQDRLFTMGSSLACDPAKEPKMEIPDLKEEDVNLLEEEIDRLSNLLEPMTSFILPGGHPVISHLHIARCICRRAERCCVKLEIESGGVAPIILKYLNRLSDYLFILSRYAAYLLKVPETLWRPRSGA
ncbi:MAG TPA: cob(I)yrinic acid a,c-diamide adenosyltransferase [Chitinophagaceae bacterium]|nr:cob(I)yrinic acid a,c-diamide adenosyltransferase [Chitinophagaceae bacterium]